MRTAAERASGNHNHEGSLRTGECPDQHRRRAVHHSRHLSPNAKARRTEGDARVSEGLHHRQRLPLEEVSDRRAGQKNRKLGSADYSSKTDNRKLRIPKRGRAMS